MGGGYAIGDGCERPRGSPDRTARLCNEMAIEARRALRRSVPPVHRAPKEAGRLLPFRRQAVA